MPGAFPAATPSPSPSLSLFTTNDSNPYRCLSAPIPPPRGSAAQISHTAIVDSGASDIYFAPGAPVTNINPAAPTSCVSDAAGNHHKSSAQATHLLSSLPVKDVKIMPTFKHNLFGVGKLCDNGCRVLFDTHSVTVFNKQNDSILLQGWRETTGAKLWRFSLLPDDHPQPPNLPAAHSATPHLALNAGDLPSIGALVHYLHAAAGFPVKATWLAAIKSGNYSSWPGLTYANAAKYCPNSTETVKGHLKQTRQGLRSTKPKPPKPSFSPSTPSHELHVYIEPVSKLYTDDMGRFPIRSRSGNQYIMLAYHSDSNAILVEPFQSRHDRHRIAAHGRIMTRLKEKGHTVDHQILDNEASKDYRQTITQDWKATYQLVPPHVHRANAAERAIQTFKAHFLSILAGIDASFPNYLWDKLLPQTEITLNLLRQSTLAPATSAWEAFHGPLNYDATPLGPIGCPVLIHNKASTRKSWDFRGREGYSIGPALLHYRCFQVVDSATKNLLISDTIEFRHGYLKQPVITYEDRLLHAVNFLSMALNDTPSTAIDAQLSAIESLRNLFAKWTSCPSTLPLQPPPLTRPQPPPPPPLERQLDPATRPQPPRVVAPTKPGIPVPPPPKLPAQPSPRVADPPTPIAHRTRSQRIPPQPGLGEAVAHRTRSKIALIVAAMAAQGQQSSAFSALNLSAAVLDHDTGKALEYRQLRKHPKLGTIWNKSYANELGRLCQGIGDNPAGDDKRVQGTDTFYVIDYEDIPIDRRTEITYTKVVCKVRPEKTDPNRTRITIGGNRICYPGDVGTRTAPLELVKLMINSVLSRKNAKFCTFDIANFYLCTPLDRPEFVRIRLDDIPQEFIEEYNLTHHVKDGWVYFKIVRGVYGLPQSGILANQLLEKRLTTAGYYQLDATPGLWRHKWRPIMFTLIVDDFGVEYVGEQHALHLRDTIKQHYDLTVNWKGDLYAGINLAWNYTKRTCRLTMEEYIATVLIKYDHPMPKKRQLSPSKAAKIIYGAKTQFTPDEDTSALLDDNGIKRIQGIVGALLYYARAVDNKLLYTLSDIGSEQAAATTRTNQKVHQLLDYCATYPNDGITFRASDMILGAHSDAAFLNVSNSRSRAAAHIMCSEDDPVPSYNGPILTIAQIIKTVMSSAAEAELAGLFICAKEMVPLRQSLIEMGWPQPKSPIQTDNTTALGVANKTIIAKRMKSMDMRLWWLRCRESQGQFRYFWGPGPTNLADYSSKAHPDIYYESQRPIHAG